MSLRQGNWSSLLIFFEILCLCISDGVGPRLVPFQTQHADSEFGKPIFQECCGQRDAFGRGDKSQTRSEFGRLNGFNKLPIFFSTEPFFAEALQISRSLEDLERRSHFSSVRSLKHGRAPPQPA